MPSISLNHIALSPLVLLVLLISCKSSEEKPNRNDEIHGYIEIAKGAYDLNRPTQVYDLARPLTEISGLAYDPVQQLILAHNDEMGNIFMIDPNSGKVDRDLYAYGAGDFEGITTVNGNYYMVTSNGDIYDVKANEVYKTALSKNNNIEGLSYDQSTHALLIAGKGYVLKRKSNDQKAIYSFDLKSKTLSEKLRYLITDQELINTYQTQSEVVASKQIRKRIKQFSPSGIAIHPVSVETYIVSAKGSLLIVIDVQGDVKNVYLLDQSLFPQPEGICFSTDGYLFLSSEGGGMVPGRIMKYAPIN